MSAAPLISPAAPVLADVLDMALAAGLSGQDEPCLWCGAPRVVVGRADMWSGSVTMRCSSCGSELSGVVPRGLREVRR